MMNKPRGIFDTTHIAQLLKMDQLEAAITELNKLQTKVITVFGQDAADREVVPQIQNLISSLKEEESSSAFTPPPPHDDRIKDRINEALDRHIAIGGAHGELAQKIRIVRMVVMVAMVTVNTYLLRGDLIKIDINQMVWQ